MIFNARYLTNNLTHLKYKSMICCLFYIFKWQFNAVLILIKNNKK